MSAAIDASSGTGLVVCVGPGGVGKTTTAAALAVDAARRGRRVLVLTIDPAKRLADALGLTGLDDEVRTVPADEVPLEGTLEAAMLDTKASYDSLIGRISRSDEERDRILANPAYRAFSRTLSRSHAYIAMERLYDVMRDGRWDLVVLDTPPTRSALDILDAPSRLSRFLDERIVRLFLSGSSATVAGRAAAPLVGLLSRLTDDSTTKELLDFFGVLAHLREGFRDRAAATSRMLRDPTTLFVLVASPMATSMADAAFLMSDLEKRGIHLDSLIFNRAFVPEPGGASDPVREADPDPHPLEEVRAIRRRFRAENDARRGAIARFGDDAGERTRTYVLPELGGDVTDLSGLALLARALRPFE